MKHKPPLKFYAIAAVLAMLTFTLTACSGSPDVPSAEVFREAIAQAQEASADIDQVIADAQAELAALPEGKERDGVLEVIAKGTAEKARVDEVLSELQTRLEAAGKDADAVDAVAIALQSAGGTLPSPWGLYAGFGGSVLLAVNRWIKATRTRRAAESVITAIEQEKATGGGKINFDDQQVKTSLRSRMSAEGLELVEEAREKAGPILIGAPLADLAEAA